MFQAKLLVYGLLSTGFFALHGREHQAATPRLESFEVDSFDVGGCRAVDLLKVLVLRRLEHLRDSHWLLTVQI